MALSIEVLLVLVCVVTGQETTTEVTTDLPTTASTVEVEVPLLRVEGCTCDLLTRYCDINCCCDPRCTIADKKSFQFCQIDQDRQYDERMCSYNKEIYVNNSLIEWKVDQEGLFCVLNRNLPASYVVQKEQPLSEEEAYEHRTPLWKMVSDDVEPQQSSYKFGYAINIIRNATPDLLRIPRSLLTSKCTFTEDVLFLQNDHSQCGQTNINSLSLSTYFENITIIRHPFRNATVAIEPRLCNINLENCTTPDNVTLQCDSLTCRNAVGKLLYRVYHNGSEGITGVELLAYLAEVTFNGEFFQEFHVEFLWINQTRNYSEIFSGNPGYIVGKPVLIADQNVTVITRGDAFSDNFFTLPDNVGGKCVGNTQIDFGYNSMSQCLFTRQIFLSRNASKNATNICQNIQDNIFGLWQVLPKVNTKKVYAFFGNALVGNSTEWGKIFYKTPSIKSVQGNFSNITNQTLFCHNITTTLDMDIIYARVDLGSLRNQNKILAITVRNVNPHKEVFQLRHIHKDVEMTVLTVALPMRSQVTFYDVTGVKKKVYVDPPLLDVRLPYDFFYPFIKVGNDGGVSRLHKATLVVGVLLELIKLYF